MNETGKSTTSFDVFANLRGWASSELLNFLDQAIRLVPDDNKYRLKQVIDSIPREGDNLQKVLELVRSQWKDLRFDASFQIAVTGPARTGKNSLLRAIEREQEDPRGSIFTVVDSQGLEEYLGYRRPQSAEEELAGVDLIILVLDARYSLSEDTRQMYERLRRLEKPVVVALNKIDLVEQPVSAVRKAQEFLRTRVFPTSIYRPETLDRLLRGIVAVDSRALYPLTRNLPGFRRGICQGIVTQSAMAAGVVGAIPIPVSDLLPMTAIQTAMTLKIARAFGFKINRGRARELLPMLAAGILVREGSHRLRVRFPAQARLIAVSVASLWTYLLGKATVQYFERYADFFHRGEVPVPRLVRREAVG